MPSTTEDHKRQLGRAFATINALEKEIEDMVARHEEELDLVEQQGLVRSQVELYKCLARRTCGRSPPL